VKISDIGSTPDDGKITLSKRQAKKTPKFIHEGSTAEDSPCDEIIDKLKIVQTSGRNSSSSPKHNIPEQL